LILFANPIRIADNRIMLDVELSRARQERLLEALRDRNLDAIVISDPQQVYYLTAYRPGWLHYAAVVLFADGKSWLTSANAPATQAAADEHACYEAQWMATIRQDQPAAVAQQINEKLKQHGARCIGADSSIVNSQLALLSDARIAPVNPVLWQLRRRKDSDELALLRKAASCADRMFHRAREIIHPGISELEVFIELQSAATQEAGEVLTDRLGNDYTSGGRGGWPRAGRIAGAGELFVVDVGPAYRGYFGDACRTFAVDGNPTDAQQEAHHAVIEALRIVERLARPGARCRDIYEAIFQHLDGKAGAKFPHHLGHGVGLQPHEYPHLNPKWDDVLMEGEVFAAEPGLYASHLAAGLRFENMYLVTRSGVEKLITAPETLT
jgi:Xaa-Pro aminopeptidase